MNNYLGPNIKQREFPEIDFLRFIAVLLVVFYHFTARRSDIFPYGSMVDGIPFNLGWVGVNLFFLISGYVISHTLKKSKDSRDFVIKRISRIYPAIWIILPIVYLFQNNIPYSIFKNRSTFANLIGSMTLIPPSVLNLFSSMNFDWITLVLWSLKVEIIFYSLCAFVFKYCKSDRVVLIIERICLFTSSLLILTLNLEQKFSEFTSKLIIGLGFDYLPWFVIGMLAYKLKFTSKAETSKICFFTVTILAIEISKLGFSPRQIAEIAMIILFLSVALRNNQPAYIKFWLIQRLGFCSYEMYLLHQGVGVPVLYFTVRTLELSSFSAFLFMLLIVIVLFISSLVLSNFIQKLNIKLRDYLNHLLNNS